ncbi:COG4315 family predicted lipoprotein [Haloarchaeobius sp. HRN-SO-5]|uniref:COG4315 family predicted lipoprotein n=1 Tax=Haloarchaeobius sp. HRN-SO-5 TaxID=3446118 RepID=UPI003EB74783
MAPTRRTLLGATATAATTLTLAGCLGGDDDTEATTPPDGAAATDEPTDTATATDTETTTGETDADGTATTTDEGAVTVQVRSHPDLGNVLVGPDGLTLYMFDNDEQGAGASTCTGDCAGAWPPLTVDGTPTAGDDVTATLSTFEREDGTTQVAANGWPLYYFSSDAAPGDAAGQGVNDVWWVLSPDGAPVRSTGGETDATSTPTGTETSTETDASGPEY